MTLLTLTLSGCSSQRKLVQEAPMKFGEATCQAWTGGRAESGSGLLLEIPMVMDAAETVVIQQAFFRGKVADVTMENVETGMLAKANFKNGTRTKPDMTMHVDAKQEVGNQPPQPKEEFPFDLEDDQCVLSFLDGDTVKYVKVEGIKDKKPLFYK